MQIINLMISFGTQVLFKDVNLHINNNEKIGVIGVNGAGKTTLFKIITGKLEPNNGKIFFENKTRVELLPQIIDDEIPSTKISVFDYLLMGRPIKELEIELEILYADLLDNNKDQNIILKKISKIQTELDYWDVYQADNILLKIISGMNISDQLLDKTLDTLSGGQKSKIAFAKLLYSKPELILLDEPTNHLDKESRDYVINYLKNYKGGVFVISHDIDFLNAITTKTLFLDKRRQDMSLFDGNYYKYKKVSIEREKALLNQAQIQEQEENKLKDFIDKYASSSGKRKKMVQDRERKLEKLRENKIGIAPKIKKMNLEVKTERESNLIPLKVEKLNFKYNKNNKENIINNLSFELIKGEKFLVVGKNGVGKSTLLKLITNQLKQDSGIITIGNKTDIGYYAQEHELLDNDKTIIDNFDNINQNQLRSVLSNFLFYGDDVFKKVSVLSPGERSRVALAKLSLIGANFLILDEPTNHLDPETQAVIAETFRGFTGTMLIVSHNPEFVDHLGVERALVLPEGKIIPYNRNEVEYYQKINNIDKNKKTKNKN